MRLLKLHHFSGAESQVYEKITEEDNVPWRPGDLVENFMTGPCAILFDTSNCNTSHFTTRWHHCWFWERERLCDSLKSRDSWNASPVKAWKTNRNISQSCNVKEQDCEMIKTLKYLQGFKKQKAKANQLLIFIFQLFCTKFHGQDSIIFVIYFDKFEGMLSCSIFGIIDVDTRTRGAKKMA